MRLDASRQPKLRKEQIENTENISDTRTERHQRIHIASAMLKLLPSTDKEASTQNKHYRSSQKPYYDIHPTDMHPNHPKHHNRYRQYNGSYRPLLHTLVMKSTSLFRFVSCLFFRCNQEVVSRILHRCLQHFRRTSIGIIDDLHRSCGIIHRCFLHSRLTIQGLVHPSCTSRTTHSQYGERFFLYHSFISSIGVTSSIITSFIGTFSSFFRNL